jgi:hypothetical protein
MRFPLTKKDLERIPPMYEQKLWSFGKTLNIKLNDISIFFIMAECTLEEDQHQVTITAQKAKTVNPISISFHKEKPHITILTF